MALQIHRLRTLVPGRLLSPIASVIHPKRGDQQSSAIKSPQDMLEQLSQAARDGVAEVEYFKQDWRGPELKSIWDRVDEKLKESNGEYPQPSGMWERDYDVLLEQLDEEGVENPEAKRRIEEEQERARQAMFESGWKGVLENFMNEDNPGLIINILPSPDNVGRFTVSLFKISTVLYVQQVRQHEDTGFGEWQVMSMPNGNTSRLENEMLNQINERDRRSDLVYLLVSQARGKFSLSSVAIHFVTFLKNAFQIWRLYSNTNSGIRK